MFLFQDPGLRRVLRFKMHNWGVANLTKIIAASHLLKQKQEAASHLLKQKSEAAKLLIKEKKEAGQQLIKEKKDSIKCKAVDKIAQAKDKSTELKNKAKNVVLKCDKKLEEKSEVKIDFNNKL